ncbi:MAG: serine/threonine protein kinase [Pseudobdellovibrio sp.]
MLIDTKNSDLFYTLDPNLILLSAEKNGFSVTGELIQLNSYENRVFEIKLENKNSIIAKYYRPGRWSSATILDEHNFTAELKKESLEVAEALILKNGSTLDQIDDINYAFFNKVRGRLVQEFRPEHYKKLGRWIARLHNIGRRQEAQHRGFLGPSEDHKWELLESLLNRVSPEVSGRYEKAAVQIFETLDERLQDIPFIRTHGDLHRGNILEAADESFVIVDFDDMINGPIIQDFWMLLPSEETKGSVEYENLVEGYSELSDFPEDQLELIPWLRGYRIINYAIWIMTRWKDPSFPKLFPDFGSYSYWAEETESLEKILYRAT